jgi:hypothetical protein
MKEHHGIIEIGVRPRPSRSASQMTMIGGSTISICWMFFKKIIGDISKYATCIS